jgi:hypothetical protein
MNDQNLTEFSGVVGRVLRSSFSWRTLATGAALGFLLLIVSFVLGVAGAPNAGVFVVQILMAVAMARFALNGLHGEWDGTVFSASGGSWSQVFSVAGRFLLATLAWLVPVFFLGLSSMAPAQALMSGPSAGPGMGASLLAFAAYMFLSTLTPPLFLIAAVSAENFGEFFSAAHWKRLFTGRSADLFMVYAAYSGALAMTFILAVPVVLGALALAWQLALLVGGIALAFVFGLMVCLMGRLCGFFAFGNTDSAPAPAAAPAGPGTATAMGRVAAAGGSLAAGVTASTVSPVQAVLGGGQPGLTGGPPVLTDTREPLAEATRKFASDPDGAIAVLEDANERYAPHPQILHALCMLTHKAGRNDDAAEYARTALPLCLDRGALPLAAEIYRTLWAVRGSLELKRDHKLQIAAVFLRSDELAYAANTYALVLQDDANDARAIKGVMQVADKFLKGRNQPAEAEKLYAYLLEVAPNSPLAEYVQQGLDSARKMATQAQTV